VRPDDGSDRTGGQAERRGRLFPTWATTAFRLALVCGAVFIVGVPTALLAWERTPYTTNQEQPPQQPVKFDHRHHARDDGIECTYCHADAFRSPTAGMPSTTFCMGCHGQIWPDSPELAPIRASALHDAPFAWRRVSNVPDFVFFDHSIHVNKGVGCVSCHGRVDQMAHVYAVASFTMHFCLDCHRAPEANLRPIDEVTSMDWTPDRPAIEVGREIARRLHVHPTTDCSGCHR
jgi:hypothetical protein